MARDLRVAPDHEPAGTLVDAVNASISAMGWTTPADEAMCAVALRLAREIDEAEQRAAEFDDLSGLDDEDRLKRLEAMCNVTKVVGWLGPQLQGVLRDLGGAPGSRKNITTAAPVGGRLAQLRAAASDR